MRPGREIALKILEEAGLIVSRKEGTKTFYKVVDTQVYGIIDALDAHGWNRQKTAEALGINRTTLYKKMKKYDIQP